MARVELEKMMRGRGTPGFLFACLLAVGGVDSRADENRIDGQVVITTKSGKNSRLGLVRVDAFPADVIGELIRKKQAANQDRRPRIDAVASYTRTLADLAFGAWQKAEEQYAQHLRDDHFYALEKRAADAEAAAAGTAKYWRDVARYLRSGLYYCDALPDAAATATTDADGKFSLVVPARGRWVLHADATRRVADGAEVYCWLVPVAVQGPTEVTLANGNLFGSGGPDALVKDAAGADPSAEQGRKHLAEAEQQLAAMEEARRQPAAQAVKAPAAAASQARLPRLIQESEARALKQHPELAKEGSSLNRKFVGRYKELLTRNDPRLQDPDWPEKLADECAASNP